MTGVPAVPLTPPTMFCIHSRRLDAIADGAGLPHRCSRKSFPENEFGGKMGITRLGIPTSASGLEKPPQPQGPPHPWRAFSMPHDREAPSYRRSTLTATHALRVR